MGSVCDRIYLEMLFDYLVVYLFLQCYHVMGVVLTMYQWCDLPPN